MISSYFISFQVLNNFNLLSEGGEAATQNGNQWALDNRYQLPVPTSALSWHMTLTPLTSERSLSVKWTDVNFTGPLHDLILLKAQLTCSPEPMCPRIIHALIIFFLKRVTITNQ